MPNWRDEREEGPSSRERQTRRSDERDDRGGVRHSARGDERPGRDERARDDERRWDDESDDERRGYEPSGRGLRMQDDYETDRSTRGPVHRQSEAQESYRPRWGWHETTRDEPRRDTRGPSRPFGGVNAADNPEAEQYRQYRRQPEQQNAMQRGQNYNPQYNPPASAPHEHEGFGRHMLLRFKEFIGKGPRNYKRSDERILEEISERLAQGYLDASDIEVVVSSGEVVLEGTVRNKYELRLAEDLIEDVMGVKQVESRLKVRRVDK